MTRFVATICSGFLLVVAGVVPAAAQPGGPCTMISDDMLSQVVGSPAHALGIISNPAAANAGQSAVSEMCVAQMSGGSAVMMTHMVGVQSPGDTNAALAMNQGGPFAALAAVDPSVLTSTTITGLGDTAVLMSGNKDGQTIGVLVAWRGTEGFSLIGSGLADPQTTLTGVAQAILNGGQ